MLVIHTLTKQLSADKPMEDRDNPPHFISTRYSHTCILNQNASMESYWGLPPSGNAVGRASCLLYAALSGTGF